MLLSALAREDSLRVKIFDELREGHPSMLDQLVEKCKNTCHCLRV